MKGSELRNARRKCNQQIVRIGYMLSNAAFNLSQKGRDLHPHDRKSLKELQVAWDEVMKLHSLLYPAKGHRR